MFYQVFIIGSIRENSGWRWESSHGTLFLLGAGGCHLENRLQAEETPAMSCDKTLHLPEIVWPFYFIFLGNQKPSLALIQAIVISTVWKACLGLCLALVLGGHLGTLSKSLMSLVHPGDGRARTTLGNMWI